MNTVEALTPTVIEVIARGRQGPPGANGTSGSWNTLADKPTTLLELGIPSSEFPGGSGSGVAITWSAAPPVVPVQGQQWGDITSGALFTYVINDLLVGAWAEL